ncbi:MAG: UDP-3-O-(3-hydroxymyristoyl)glucosamine N-acyltransferase [Acidobacteriales bacterium]|nr:UDP-3-O-(3-hydroxymyristoyl)glucosamine N-acyltransferase [Candidatus Koribacter versatilis]MBI3644490.1 UDP-3-O-(3-hydroxymyristoyl)glucosamine N-acyltransferase [Terriglobales bacterium]
MKQTLGALAEKLACRVLGDSSVPVSNVASVTSAAQDSLIFVEDPKHLAAALSSRAAAIIAGEFANVVAAKPLLISAQPRLTFARAAKLLQDSSHHQTGSHPSAIVPASARIGANVAIGPRAVLGEHVQIGDGSTIAPGCVLGDGVEIGAYCRLDPNVTIYSGTTLGERVVVQAGAVLGSEGFGYVRDNNTGRYEQFPQVGRLVIEDDVGIGANSTVDRGALDETRIRRGTKIDNLVQIGHNVQIGRDVVIAAQTGLSGSVVVGDNVIMGGQVGIGDHARIEEGVILGGGCGILPKKVVRGKGVVFWGTPARPLREYLKELAFLSRSAKKDRAD